MANTAKTSVIMDCSTCKRGDEKQTDGARLGLHRQRGCTAAAKAGCTRESRERWGGGQGHNRTSPW